MVERATVRHAFYLKRQGVMQALAPQPKSPRVWASFLWNLQAEWVSGGAYQGSAFRSGVGPSQPKAPCYCACNHEYVVEVVNCPSRWQETAARFSFPFLMCGPLRLELSHPQHALIRLSLGFFFLARSLVILASTVLDRKNVDLSGWQLVQCKRAVILEDIPMASVWAFLFSQESARPRVLGVVAMTEDT